MEEILERNPPFPLPLASGLFGLPSGQREHPGQHQDLVVNITNRSARPLSYRCYSEMRPDRHPLFAGEVAPKGTVRIERLGSECSPMLHSLLIEARPALHTRVRSVLQAMLFLLAVIVFTAGAYAAAVGAKAGADRSTIVTQIGNGNTRPASRFERRRLNAPLAMRCPYLAIRAKTPICGGFVLA
jgi:hypothetical protein